MEEEEMRGMRWWRRRMRWWRRRRRHLPGGPPTLKLMWSGWMWVMPRLAR